MTMKEKKSGGRSNVRNSQFKGKATTFARRSKGLLKKASELSTLVGIDVCVILVPPQVEDCRGSSSSLPSPVPLTWPEQPSDVLRIIHRFQSAGHRKRRNHRSCSSSTSLPPPPLLQSPDEPSDRLPITLGNSEHQNPQNSSPAPSFRLEEIHALEQQLQQMRRQNSELIALSPSCDSTGPSKDVEPSLILEPMLDDSFPTMSEEMKRISEEKEFLEFLECLTPNEGENIPTATHQEKEFVDIGQSLILDDLPPSPMPWSSSECWDFSFLQEYSPIHCPSQLQSGCILETEMSLSNGVFGYSNALPGF